MIEKNPKRAHNKFKKLFQEYKSPRALFGLAASLNKLALTSDDPHEAKKLQHKAADKFCQVMTLNLVPLFLFMSTGTQISEMKFFKAWFLKLGKKLALQTHIDIIEIILILIMETE